MPIKRSLDDVQGKVSAIVYHYERTPDSTLLDSRNFVRTFVHAISGEDDVPWNMDWNRFLHLAVTHSIQYAHRAYLDERLGQYNRLYHTHYKIRL